MALAGGGIWINEKSRRMQMQLGYKDKGIRRKNVLCLATNEYVDECVTELLKEDFVEYNNLIPMVWFLLKKIL